MKRNIRSKSQAGFSLTEMMVVVAMSIIITAIAIPGYMSTSQYLRIAGDLRALNGVTAQAKMRAAAGFTHARIYADLTDNTYQLQVWNKTGGTGGAGCWVSDLDPNPGSPTCITYSGTAPSGPGVLPLGQGDTFGYGSLTSGPTPGQTTIGQAANCTKDDGSTISSTGCIVFNSRGIPIDTSNSPLATGALYVTNSIVVNGVTVSATGSIQAWSVSASGGTWHGM